MELRADSKSLNESNLFLRALWAELRRICGKCDWQYTPSKDGKAKRIFLGFADIGRPEGVLDVSVLYVQRGTINSICFAFANGVPVPRESALGKLLIQIVQAAKTIMSSPTLRSYETTIEALRLSPSFYKGQSFRITPRSKRWFSLAITVACFDETDARTQLIPRMRRMLDVLSVETNSAFWPGQNKTPEEDEPLASNVKREVVVHDPDWMDDYPIHDGLFLISAQGKRLLQAVAKEETLVEPIATFTRACNHFHTARKYHAQIWDVLELGAPERTEQAEEHVVSVNVRNSRLEAAGQVGAAHAEITGTLYMSALEVASKIGAAEPEPCPQCGQPRYRISQRVTDLMTKHGGPKLGQLAKAYYSDRSKYLHEGIMLSDSSYAGVSIPLLDPSGPTGCRTQTASPSPNLQEYTGFCMRRVLKEIVNREANA